MSRIAFVTDSTAYIPDEFCARYKIVTVPQILIWEEKTYKDGVDILPREFYQKLQTAKGMPTTSQVPVQAMRQAFTELVNEGYEVLGVFISSKLSGTLQSALTGRDEMVEGKDKIEIVDSLTTSMAMGFQILVAARAAEAGGTLAECKTLIEKSRPNTGVYFVVDTLEFLHRGGRIGGAQRFFGTALNLKPILSLQDGKVEAIERIRTKNKALDRMIEIVIEQCAGKPPVHMAVLHANAPDEANRVLEEICKRLKVDERVITNVSPVVGAHAGPGTVGLAFLTGI